VVQGSKPALGKMDFVNAIAFHFVAVWGLLSKAAHHCSGYVV